MEKTQYSYTYFNNLLMDYFVKCGQNTKWIQKWFKDFQLLTEQEQENIFNNIYNSYFAY